MQGDDSRTFQEIDHMVTVTTPSILNVEQKQAFLLAIRGVCAAELGIEGCPGAGKSKTLQSVAAAMLLMGFKVCVSAQSNNGVDAVFGKIVKCRFRRSSDWSRPTTTAPSCS